MTQVTASTVLDTIAGALVNQEKYHTKEDALRALALDAVHAKIGHYRRRILRLQRKYSQDFAAFSRSLQDNATPQQEDDWLDWRTARAMLEEWQAVYTNLSKPG